jgi:carboxymethylenebutenolidase
MSARSPFLLAAALALAAATATAEDDHAKKMGREHAHDAPVASPAAALAPRQPVVEEVAPYATLGGKRVVGLLARPKVATGPLPGLIVIQEWWGLNDNIRAMTRRLAGEGYVALAVDLYEGNLADTPDAAMAEMQAAMKDPARLAENLRQAREFLRRKDTTRVGVVGWCFGGGWSLQTALDRGEDIDAAVVYYGRTIADPAELSKLHAPLLGLFGGRDEGIPIAGVRAMEAELAKLGKDATIVVYEDADHAFANPSGTRYQAAAAEDAWKRTREFFERHLKAAPQPAPQPEPQPAPAPAPPQP